MGHIAYIGLGSNLNNPCQQLQCAFDELDLLAQTRVLARSSLYRSAPLGYADQPDYANAVAKILTELNPQDLLQSLLQIEYKHGRERTFRNAPRTLDLDMLLYDDMEIQVPNLTIPHPQMHLRAFVLRPLLEIAPDVGIPGKGLAAVAYAACQDQVLQIIAD
jgi:2-amino-4-hydroxy-6-hydroxymethyldihydropteridine diphosphokinase